MRTRTITLRETNWLSDPAATDCVVKVRSTRAGVAARIVPLENGMAQVEIPGGEDSVSPGQACVVYAGNGSRVLGGGWIAGTEMAAAAPDRLAAEA